VKRSWCAPCAPQIWFMVAEVAMETSELILSHSLVDSGA
jgi:hypothetical protein